jgi:uncharacterized OB-fold protein
MQLSAETPPAPLSAPYVLEYAYHRSVGPVLAAFFGALKDRRITGSRTADGRVIVPPAEFDAHTGEALTEIVDVKDSGVVTSWTWVAAPDERHPLAHPFAFALVRLDGAGTAMLHAVDAGSEAAMRSGMRVRARWRDETAGEMLDIACFEPEPAP